MKWHSMDRAERTAYLTPRLAARQTMLSIAEELGTTRNAISGFVIRNMRDTERRRQVGFFEWTRYKIDRLGQLARAGSSAKEIAAILKAPSTASVYSKAREKGIRITGMVGPKNRKPQQKPLEVQKDANEARAETARRINAEKAILNRLRSRPAVPLPEVSGWVEGSVIKPLMARRMGYECSYIAGDAKADPALCCGAPTDYESSWCSAHREIVYSAH